MEPEVPESLFADVIIPYKCLHITIGRICICIEAHYEKSPKSYVSSLDDVEPHSMDDQLTNIGPVRQLYTLETQMELWRDWSRRVQI